VLHFGLSVFFSIRVWGGGGEKEGRKKESENFALSVGS
jgi:hypothetical protein